MDRHGLAWANEAKHAETGIYSGVINEYNFQNENIVHCYLFLEEWEMQVSGVCSRHFVVSEKSTEIPGGFHLTQELTPTGVQVATLVLEESDSSRKYSKRKQRIHTQKAPEEF